MLNRLKTHEMMPGSVKMSGNLLAAVITVGLAVLYTGPAITADNKHAGQQETITHEGAEVTTSLVTKPVVVLVGVELCDPKFSYFQTKHQTNLNAVHIEGANTTYVLCTGDNCVSVLDFPNDKIPPHIVITRRYQDKCVTQDLDNLAHYTRTKSIGVITITNAMKQQWNVKEQVEQTGHSVRPATLSTKSANGATVVSIDYGESTPQEDEFLFGGSKLVKVSYSQ